MSRHSGALRIFQYNWPVYAGTWLVALASLASLHCFSGAQAWLLGSGALLALLWSLVSLLVSLYVYDRSPLVAGRWVPGLLGPGVHHWAAVDAGLDAEVLLHGVLPGRCLGRLDIFDPAVMTSPAIARARARTPREQPALACPPTALTLADASCDAIVVAFTAHEIRDRDARERFFGELRRALLPGGKALIVEHLRDWPNFLAFGPGYLHFVARSEWLRLAAGAGLRVAAETRVTPWVMALTLERPQ